MPPDLAFGFNPEEAMAFAVAFGEIESGGKSEFDFEEGEWRER